MNITIDRFEINLDGCRFLSQTDKASIINYVERAVEKMSATRRSRMYRELLLRQAATSGDSDELWEFIDYPASATAICDKAVARATRKWRERRDLPYVTLLAVPPERPARSYGADARLCKIQPGIPCSNIRARFCVRQDAPDKFIHIKDISQRMAEPSAETCRSRALTERG